MLAYFDCFSGIAGDMTLAAMIDLGLDEEFLKSRLSCLPVSGYRLNVRRSLRRGVSGVRVDVDIAHDHPHRSYADIQAIIGGSGIGDQARETALKIFDVLAEAEAKVHAVPKAHVHFHEVGAVDSIIDIVGAAIGVHSLGVERVVCSPLPLGRGFVKTAHGNLPTPAPATLEIIKGVPVVGAETSIELVTPTGAAIARTLAWEFGDYPSFVPERTGYGLGKSDPEEFPNALRIVLGAEPAMVFGREKVGVIECQVDDLDPRALGDLMDLLLVQGALDVTFTPVQMKKNRPGVLTAVLAPLPQIREFCELLMSHTTTLGVRLTVSERFVLPRRAATATTSLGEIRVKIVELPDGRIEKRPEFEDARAIGRNLGIPVRRVLEILHNEVNC
jgi:hypothetical protein